MPLPNQPIKGQKPQGPVGVSSDFDPDPVGSHVPFLDEALPPETPPEEEDKPTQQPVTTGIAEEITRGVTEAVTVSSQVQQLLSDPQIQQYLMAKRNGKNVQLIDPQTLQQQRPPEPEPDWEALKEDPKAMTQHLLKTIRTDTKSELATTLQEVLSPLVEKIQGLESVIQAEQGNQLKTKIKATAEKYPDFEQLKPKMREVYAEVGGNMTPEELYFLTKMRLGQKFKPEEDTTSERPSGALSKHKSANQKKEYPTGRRGLQMAMDDALNELDLDEIDLGPED